MKSPDEYQWKKLNDYLSTSFNNVKYDVRDIRGQVDKLRAVFAHFSTNSIKQAFEAQTKVILELQQSINLLQTRVNELESRESSRPINVQVKPQPVQPHSMVIPEPKTKIVTKTKIVKVEKKPKSVYDFKKGIVKITKVQFKAKKNGKKNVNGEWVEVTGYGGVNLTGYKLYDQGRKHTFRFPKGFKIYAPVKIMTGKGRNTNTRLYWGQPRPVWNDSGDVATLATKTGKVVSQVASAPDFTFKVKK